MINKYKVYDIDTRAYDSLGNFMVLQTSSYKIYLKKSFKLTRYSFLCSARSLGFFIDEDFDLPMQFLEINQIRNSKFSLTTYFDLVLIDEDLNESN